MNRIAVMTGLLVLGSFPPATPALAKVGVSQGLSIAGTPLVVTSQREIYVMTAAGVPARRLGRLPRGSSPLVSSGSEAWAVKSGRQRGRSIRLYRIEPASREVEHLRVASSSVTGQIDVDGIAGADSRYVYLLPDGRFDRQRAEIQPGHLDHHPGLQLLCVRTRGGRAWYLARDRQPDVDGAVRLWLLHDSIWNDQGLRVTAGIEEGPVDMFVDDQDLFLVFQASRVLRFDGASLRLLEDLSPMLRDERIHFFAADDRYYWVGTSRAAHARDEAAAGTGGVDRDAAPGGEAGRAQQALWRIERDNLDGGLFHAGALPESFVPLEATGDDLWFGALESRDPNPVLAVDKGDGTSRSYGIRGRHARFWRAFGRGALNAGERTAIIVVGVPLVAIAILTVPFWFWAV